MIRYRPKPGRLAALAAAVCLQAASATAQRDSENPSAETSATARYTVELIVFTYDDASSAGNEVFAPRRSADDFPADAPPHSQDAGEAPVFDDRSPLPVAAAERTGRTGTLREVPARGRIELERLAPDQFRMQETYRKLLELDAYRPILHTAWTQTTHARDSSPALPLRSLSDPPLGLNGSITLYQSRFLHLEVDLSLDATPENPQRSATDRPVARDAAPDRPSRDNDGDVDEGLLQPAVRYRISEDRIVRDGDVRYFDHPRFGMLARVTRVDGEDEAVSPADTGGGRLGDGSE